MDRPGVRQVPEGSGEQEKMEESGCKIIYGAPATLGVKGYMKMMMILPLFSIFASCDKQFNFVNMAWMLSLVVWNAETGGEG